MRLQEEEASNSIKTAIEAQRTDVLKAVLDTIIKGTLLFWIPGSMQSLNDGIFL